MSKEVVIHRCPPDGCGLMPCCGRTPFERMSERMTEDPRLVTCNEAPWFWLSFCDDTGFKGGCYVQSNGGVSRAMEPVNKAPDAMMLARALRKAHELGINPGGSVMSLGPVSPAEFEQQVPPELRNVLLSKEDLKRIGGFVNQEGELTP